ncbi:hypothetical protein ACGRL8_13315 [Vibrio rumoiensis]|uniref:Fimbrial protein n=1 Tax=Vibrio rumoiensis TaxID=76258 RepID=A0ABW7IZI7_9VIBR
MKKFLFKYCYYLFFLLFFSFGASAVTLNADIVGDQIKWKNANVIDGNIVQMIWESSANANVHPVYEWRPAFNKSSQNSIVFESSIGASVETEFEHTGVEFRYGGQFSSIDANANYNHCNYESSPAGYYALVGSTSCVAEKSLSSQNKYKPFEFYRSSIQLNSLVQDFKEANVPSGLYYTNVQLPLSYMVSYSGVESYQTSMISVTIVINYTPSFLDSVTIDGDGVFKLDYDTTQHTVSGSTKFNVNVKGHIEPGLKMTFESLGNPDEFNLNHTDSDDSIPYNLRCEQCERPQVIYNGNRIDEYSNIPYVGDNMNFYLDFNFKNLEAGEVEEGEYKDAVKVLFEIDL